MLSLKDFIFLINKTIDTQLDTDAIIEVSNMELDSNPDNFDYDEFENQIQNVLEPLEVCLVAPILINGSLRLFENPVLYQADSYDHQEFRVTITTLHSKVYANTLHALTNPFVIKKSMRIEAKCLDS